MRQSNQYQKVRLSTIYTRYFDDYLADPKHPISEETLKAVNQTIACRTSRIGVAIYQCPECYEHKHVLRSCKNRFCPQCGYADTKRWAFNMLDKIADCWHHHIVFTLPASLAGIPGLSVPCGFSSDKLPIGLQILGPHFREELILRIAYQFEQATPHLRSKPELA